MNKKQNPIKATAANQNFTRLAHCAWLLSMSTLWPSCIVDKDEQSAAQEIIRKRLVTSDNAYQTYLEIAQRVLLTRRRMIADKGYAISSLPTRFFNSTEKGFAASKFLFEELLKQRKISRIFCLELRALAEAVWEFSEDAIAENYEYWKNWFIQNGAMDEWVVFSYAAGLILLSQNKSKTNEKGTTEDDYVR